MKQSSLNIVFALGFILLVIHSNNKEHKNAVDLNLNYTELKRNESNIAAGLIALKKTIEQEDAYVNSVIEGR